MRPTQHPATFWIRRFFRLYPVYWLSVLLVVLTLWAFRHDSFSARQVLANLTMLQNFFRYENLEGVYWTLKLELFFYAVCYMLFFLKLLDRTIVLVALSAILAIVFVFYLDYWSGPIGFTHHLLKVAGVTFDVGFQHAASTGDDHPIPTVINMNWGNFCAYFSVMFLGASLRQWYERRMSAFERRSLILLLAFWLIAMPVLGATAYRATHDLGLFSVFGSWSLAVILFVVLTFLAPIRAKTFAVLGLISYSLYLMHPIIIDSLLGSHVGAWLASVSPLAFVFLCALLAITVSLVSYRFVELPCINAGHRLADMLNLPSGGVQAIRD